VRKLLLVIGEKIGVFLQRWMKYLQDLLREKPSSLLMLIWSSLSFRYIANHQRGDIL